MYLMTRETGETTFTNSKYDPQGTPAVKNLSCKASSIVSYTPSSTSASTAWKSISSVISTSSSGFAVLEFLLAESRCLSIGQLYVLS